MSLVEFYGRFPGRTAIANRIGQNMMPILFRWLTACGWLFALSILIATGKASDERVPDLEIVRSSYIQAISSIRTLDCRFSQKRLGDLPRGYPETMVSSNQVHYVRAGSRRMLSQNAGDAAGKAGIRIWASFDGKLYSSWAESLMENAEQGYFAPWGRVEAEAPSVLSSIETIDSFLGYRLAGGQLDLERLILQPTTRVVGWDNVGQHRCVRLALPEHAPSTRKPDDLWHTVVWLDPSFDYLPRQIHSAAVRNEQLSRNLLIEEFERFEGRDGERAVFLPKTAIWKGGPSKRQTVLESAIVNQPISAELFNPKFPVGTMVKESIPGQPVRIYPIGDAETRKQLVAKSVQKTAPTPLTAISHQIPSARPSEPGTSIWFVVLRSTAWMSVVVVVGIIAWRAFRRA